VVLDVLTIHSKCQTSQGYILYWLWASRHKSLVEVKKQDLTMTGSMVLQLIQQGLPSHRNNYTVYMDNYFTTIPLFDRLRQLGIGACGTTRPNASKKLFPKSFKLAQRFKKISAMEYFICSSSRP
jgi:hypothetical protein